ncbi:MAG: hypothetical protein ABEK59_12355 [Halobacteria archaeon]
MDRMGRTWIQELLITVILILYSAPLFFKGRLEMVQGLQIILASLAGVTVGVIGLLVERRASEVTRYFGFRSRVFLLICFIAGVWVVEVYDIVIMNFFVSTAALTVLIGVLITVWK